MRLILVVAGMLMVGIDAKGYRAPITVAETDVISISSAASQFEATYGSFPPETNWVAELTGGSNSVLNSHKIKFVAPAAIRDPWGRRIVYHYPGKHRRGKPDIYSLGADGRSSSDGNDPDDVNNWDESRPWSSYYSKPAINLQWVGVIAGCFALMLVIYAARNRWPKHVTASI
jgi:hypothetical protein